MKNLVGILLSLFKSEGKLVHIESKREWKWKDRPLDVCYDVMKAYDIVGNLLMQPPREIIEI